MSGRLADQIAAQRDGVREHRAPAAERQTPIELLNVLDAANEGLSTTVIRQNRRFVLVATDSFRPS